MEFAMSDSSDTDTEISFTMETLEIESLTAQLTSITHRLESIAKQSSALESSLSFYSRPMASTGLLTPEDIVHSQLKTVGLAGRTVNSIPVYTWFLLVLTSSKLTVQRGV